MVTQAFNPSTWRQRQGGQVFGHLRPVYLHGEFQTNQGYEVRLCLKEKRREGNRKGKRKGTGREGEGKGRVKTKQNKTKDIQYLPLAYTLSAWAPILTHACIHTHSYTHQTRYHGGPAQKFTPDMLREAIAEGGQQKQSFRNERKCSSNEKKSLC